MHKCCMKIWLVTTEICLAKLSGKQFPKAHSNCILIPPSFHRLVLPGALPAWFHRRRAHRGWHGRRRHNHNLPPRGSHIARPGLPRLGPCPPQIVQPTRWAAGPAPPRSLLLVRQDQHVQRTPIVILDGDCNDGVVIFIFSSFDVRRLINIIHKYIYKQRYFL